jgi:hypothetical protein
MMRRFSTASVLPLRLLLVATIVAQLAPLPLYANTDALTEAGAPRARSSVCGSAGLDGAAAAGVGAVV